MITYMVNWLKHAKSDHHLTIDYVGGRNERGYDLQWYKDFKAALRANGLSSIQVIASDDWPKNQLWAIASEMKKDAAVNDAIDIVGAHGPGWGGYPTPDAASLGKPLWDSESHYDEKPPYNEAARNINRNYAAGKVTATIYWPIVSAIYDNLPYHDIGMIKCNQPWSGHFVVTPSLWVFAHTTQFTKPGWQYIDSASGFFSGDTTGAHGSFVSLRSPTATDYSVIVETVEAKMTQTAHFKSAGFQQNTLHVWSTNLTSNKPSDWFLKQADIASVGGEFAITLEPGHMYTLTTTAGQAKGNAVPPQSAPFNLPYADSFDSYLVGKLPKYFSDLNGAFETAHCDGNRAGICLSQLTPEEPIPWKEAVKRPFTILGNLDWSDYRVSSDILLQQEGSAELLGRLSGMSDHDVPNSYLLRVSDTGNWLLVKTSTKQEEVTLASGKVNPLGVHMWHKLSLAFQGESISAEIDGVRVAKLADASYAKGMVGLGLAGYIRAQFDEFKVERLQPKS
jgi:hypothetical protein